MSGAHDDRRDIRALLSRIWAAVVRYRRMVAAMVVLAVLQTVFTKLPFLVVKPLMAEMGKAMGQPATPVEGGGLDAELQDSFNAWFAGFAADICALFGMNFGSSGMNVVVACGVVDII